MAGVAEKGVALTAKEATRKLGYEDATACQPSECRDVFVIC